MECVPCGAHDIAEPIVFVHFLLFDLMGGSFLAAVKENILLYASRFHKNLMEKIVFSSVKGRIIVT